MPRIWKQDRENTEDNLIDSRMNSETPASVNIDYDIIFLPKLSSVMSRNADFQEQQVACFRFDVFPGELVSNSALFRVTILSLVSVSGSIFEQAPSFILFHSMKNTKIISCNLTSTNVLINIKNVIAGGKLLETLQTR